MSKMSELALVIDEMITCGEGIIKTTKELTDCGERLIQTAKKLKELFSTEAPQTPKALEKKNEAPKKEEKTYSKEDVRGILAGKSAKGYGKEVKALLSKYGADKLSTLSLEHYAAVVADAEEIGNE